MTELSYRKIAIGGGEGPQTLDREARTVRVIAATETPVRIYDQRYGAVDEILLMSGARIPESKQVPLHDSHKRFSISDVLGSYRGIEIVGDKMEGVTHFSSVEEKAFAKVAENHITDFSVGYAVRDHQFVREGEKLNVRGREYTGPVKIVTDWELKELSLVSIGADSKAKARAEQTEEKEKDMSEKDKAEETRAEKVEAPEVEEVRAKAPEVDIRAEIEQVKREAKEEAIREMEAKRETEESIKATCKRFGFDPEDYLKRGLSFAEVKEDISTKLFERHEGGIFTHSEDASDKFARQAADGICLRIGMPVDEGVKKAGNPFASMTAMEMGKELLRREGVRFDHLDVMELAGRIMTTSAFANIISTVANKAVKIGFMEKPYKWAQFCSVGSAPNFLQQTEVEISRGGTLSKITTELPELSVGMFEDGAQTYKLDSYGKQWGFGRKMLINDQMNMIFNLQRMGQTAARTIEKLVFEYIESNPTLADGVALFHSDHGNLVDTGSGKAPGLATFNAAELAMSNQLDIDGETELDIEPAYFLTHTTLKGYTAQFLASDRWNDEATIGTPDESVATTRPNIWGGGRLDQVYSSRLANTTAWYFLGDKGTHFEVFFLNGRQEPVIEQWYKPETKDRWVSVMLDVGVRVKDYRAAYKNAGV